jgi:hypothetical protein
MQFEPTLLKLACTICRSNVTNVSAHLQGKHAEHGLTPSSATTVATEINECCYTTNFLYLPIYSPGDPMPPYKHLERHEGQTCLKCGYACGATSMGMHNIHPEGRFHSSFVASQDTLRGNFCECWHLRSSRRRQSSPTSPLTYTTSPPRRQPSERPSSCGASSPSLCLHHHYPNSPNKDCYRVITSRGG